MEAYFIISELRTLTCTIGSSRGAYISSTILYACSSSAPITILSALKVSLTAVPCERNSGFETTKK